MFDIAYRSTGFSGINMSVFKKVLQEWTPPALVKLLRTAHSDYTGEVKKRTIHDLNEFHPKTLSHSMGEVVFNVPVEKIRCYGGVPYDYSHHHFLQYYRDGITALIRYYQTHQPENIFEKHYLPTPPGYDPEKFEEQHLKANALVPWLYSTSPMRYKGEKGLGSEHGNQAFGPVSDEKIALEAHRLDSILYSITESGFEPEKYDGYPRGYFLFNSNNEWVFYLRGGFHRVGALIHMGYKSIPFEFMPKYPRIIRESESAEWPAVQDGHLTEEQALAIFRQYFR